MLTQSEEFGQVEGIKDVAGQLKSRMKGFTCHLEEIRNRIEDNAKCYHLLDKVCTRSCKTKFLFIIVCSKLAIIIMHGKHKWKYPTGH